MNYQCWQEISYCLEEVDKEREKYENSGFTSGATETVRGSIVHHLENLKVALEKILEKHTASLVMFAIIAAIDEKMQGYDHLHAGSVKWVPIQKDFFAANTAGEVFYKTLDEVLENDQTPNIVYQVFYTMLKRGFQGKYQESKTQIGKYMEMLKDRIPVTATTLAKEEKTLLLQNKEKGRLKRWHCYAFSCAGFALVVLALLVTSN